MDDYLSKPVSLADLDKMVRKWLPRAAALRAPVSSQTAEATPPRPFNENVAGRPQESTGANTATPPIDMAALGALLGDNDPELLGTILEAFLTTMDGTPETLRDLAAGNDAAALTTAAHAAKGAAASACAEALATLCKDMEAAGRRADWAEIRRLVPGIHTAFEDVRIFIAGELSRSAMREKSDA